MLPGARRRDAWALVTCLVIVGALVSPTSAPAGPQPASTLQNHADSGAITVYGFVLRYRIEGTGPPAIVIGSSVYVPRTFSANLHKDLRLVFLDHRGVTPPPSPAVGPGDSLCARDSDEDVELARQKLGLERLIVIGHSGHAYMALEYAKKSPQHVSLRPSLSRTRLPAWGSDKEH